jgi:hypothetical protein
MITLIFVLLSSAPETQAQRMQREDAEFRAGMLKACPKRQTEIDALSKGSVDAFTPLSSCGRTFDGFFMRLGNAKLMTNDFSGAESAYRAALKLRVTDSAELGLLTALSRVKERTPAQQAEFDSTLARQSSHPCTREDLCAGLSYIAWHVDAYELATSSAERAIELGYTGWQPHFVAGTIYAGGINAQRTKAIEYLQEAKRRGGPASAIDGFLSKLGVR